MTRRFWFRAWMTLLVALALVGPGARPAVAQPAPTAYSRYEIDAQLDPALSVLNAAMTLDWVNGTGESQGSVFFRVYPNAFYYGDGALTVLEATADGTSFQPVVAEDPTVLELPLPAAVAPGARATVTFRFQTAVPTEAPDELGIFQRDARGVWSLANWYPIVAGYEPGTGWNLDTPTISGDPMFSDVADYRVRFRTPAGTTVFGTGTETSTAQADGTLLTEATAPLAREFALTVLPGEVGTEVASETVHAGDTGLALTLPRDVMIPGLKETILDTAAEALPVYERWFGEYAGENLDITTVDLSRASAVAFSGTVWLDLEPFVADGELNEIERIRLRFVIIHEIGHQWIGGVIGANTNSHQFMAEGLVNMLTVAVIREIDGPADAERYLRADVAGGYQALLRDGRDGIADQPVTDDINGVLYSLYVYGKAGVGFEAIRQQIGNEAFFAAMAAYGEEFRFGIATPDDLQRVLENAAGQDLDALWAFWFEQEGATPADVDAVLDGYAESTDG